MAKLRRIITRASKARYIRSCDTCREWVVDKGGDFQPLKGCKFFNYATFPQHHIQCVSYKPYPKLDQILFDDNYNDEES